MRDSLIEKEKIAIERLKMFEPNANQEPYYLAYSGGKDSDTIKILAQLAGVRYEAVNNHTTVDAPETVYYIRSQKDVKVEYPEKTMWQLIVEKLMPPTRIIRYCCAELKERGGDCRRVITGVRWAESIKRKENADVVRFLKRTKDVMAKAEEYGIDFRETRQGGIILNSDNAKSRELVEDCYLHHKVVINPIVDWSDDDVWEFLHHYGCKSNPLYECGYKRIGCIGCPMAAKHRYKEFNDYPKYKLNYIRAFDRMLERRKERGLGSKDEWKSGKDVFKWWMGEDINQLSFFGEDL